MVTSSRRRGPAGPRRALLYMLAALLLPIVLLAPAASPPRSTERSGETRLNPSAASPASSADGNSAGGSLRTGGNWLLPAADASRLPDGQPTTAVPDMVRVTSTTSLYDVEGSNVRTLLASLRQRGPVDGDERWAASTAWMFRWSYQPVM